VKASSKYRTNLNTRGASYTMATRISRDIRTSSAVAERVRTSLKAKNIELVATAGATIHTYKISGSVKFVRCQRAPNAAFYLLWKRPSLPQRAGCAKGQSLVRGRKLCVGEEGFAITRDVCNLRLRRELSTVESVDLNMLDTSPSAIYGKKPMT